MKVVRSLPFVAALSLGACASYTPHPLDQSPAALSTPTAATLNAAAAAIHRPYLAPTTIDLSAPLDLNAIATIAVIANPDLKALRAQSGVADAQVFDARLLPDPTFSVGANSVLSGPDPFLDIASALGLDVNALRTQHVMAQQAQTHALQVRLDLAWAEWQTAGKARIEAVRVQDLQQLLKVDQASDTAGQSLLDRTLRAASHGDLPANAVQAQRLAAYDALNKRQTTQRDLAAARYQLTQLLGLPPATPLKLAPMALPPPPPDAKSLFALAQANRADLQALRAGYASQEASVHKAILDQFPALTLTLNANRDSAGNALVGPAVAFSLPLWNRNRGGIAIARATRAALKAEYDARLFQTRADIAAAVAGIAVARRQRSALLRDLPALEQFATASRRAANHGDLAPAIAQSAAQALRDKQALLAQSDQAIAEQTIALELLTGTPREAWPQ